MDEGKPPGTAYDGPETRPPGGNDAGPPAKDKGGGGHKGFDFSGAYQPYQGIQSHPQFVSWQPSAPGQPVQGSTIFSGGGPSSTPAPPAPAPGKPAKGGKGAGKGGGQGAAGNGAGGGSGAGKPGGTGRGPGQPASGGQRPASGPGGPTAPPFIPGAQNITPPDLRSGIFGGVDTNYLDYRTPGWLRDPTTGTYNTSGLPNQTPFAPTGNNRGGPNQAFDQYVTALHDAGFTQDDIMSLVGPYGYRLDNGGNWQWGWGTGPVVSTGAQGGGYTFARGASGIGGTTGGKDGNTDKPNTADRLQQGWTPTAAYI